MRRKVRQNLIGMTFGRLTVLEQANDHIKPSGQHETMWLCKCTCGNTKAIRAGVLKNGSTQSCGCIFTEVLQERNKNNTYSKLPPNDTIIDGAYVKILFSDGTYTTVDLDVYNTLLTDKRIFKTKAGYAALHIKQKDKRRLIKLHQFILGVLAEDIAPNVIDHINRDKLDNRKENLRIVSVAENVWNRSLSPNKLGCNCVEFTGSAYRVRVHINGQLISLGSFKTQQEAEDCYNNFIKENRQINKKL